LPGCLPFELWHLLAGALEVTPHFTTIKLIAITPPLHLVSTLGLKSPIKHAVASEGLSVDSQIKPSQAKPFGHIHKASHPPRNLLAAADNIRSASGSPIRSLRFLRGLHPPRTETCNYFRSASGAFLFSSPPLSLSRFSSSTCLKSFSVLISSLADASFYCSAHWRALNGSSSQSLISVGPCLLHYGVARGKGIGIEV